jgi:hypothetical protein
MDAHVKSVREILHSGDQFLVPFFQRHYSWRKNNWQQLLDDLIALTEEEDTKHFLGPLVCTPFHPVPGEVTPYQLIDGQQRLMTITISLAALRDVARLAGFDEVAAEIHEDFLIHRRRQGLQRLTVVPRVGDRDYFANRFVYRLAWTTRGELHARFDVGVFGDAADDHARVARGGIRDAVQHPVQRFFSQNGLPGEFLVERRNQPINSLARWLRRVSSVASLQSFAAAKSAWWLWKYIQEGADLLVGQLASGGHDGVPAFAIGNFGFGRRRLDRPVEPYQKEAPITLQLHIQHVAFANTGFLPGFGRNDHLPSPRYVSLHGSL